MHIPYGTSREQALKMIEFEFEDRVPIPPSAAVYDYNELSQSGIVSDEVAVVVFPRDVADAYVEAFEGAGITLLSLEIEARSIAAVGGEGMTQALIQRLSMTPEEAEIFKNEQGLLSDKGAKPGGLEIVSGTASALSDEILRHYRYWDTRRNEHGERMTPVGRVLLVGGSSNLKGLPDYVSGRVQAPTERGDVWRHVASFDEYIPPVDRQHSLQYATAIGLALRGLSA